MTGARAVPRGLAAVFAASALLLGGCSSDDAGPKPAAAKAVALSDTLVPKTVGAGVTLHRNTSKSAVDAFAKAGPGSLVTDGRVYEVRMGTQLVGVLQISALRGSVRLDGHTQRSIVAQLLSGSVQRIPNGPVTVYASKQGQLSQYLWFGHGIYEVLQVRGLADRGPSLAKAIVQHQLTQPAFVPLRSSEGMRRTPPR